MSVVGQNQHHLHRGGGLALASALGICDELKPEGQGTGMSYRKSCRPKEDVGRAVKADRTMTPR